MFEVLLIIIFGVMAFRVVIGVNREADLITELKLPMTLVAVMPLYPAGPFLLLIGADSMPFPLAFIAAAACFLPGLLIANRFLKGVKAVGTERVKALRGVATEAFGTAIAGLAYVGINLILATAVMVIGRNF
jgi:hypothetical protein